MSVNDWLIMVKLNNENQESFNKHIGLYEHLSGYLWKLRMVKHKSILADSD